MDSRGLQRYVVLFFIKVSTRRVEVAGIASVANGVLMSQLARKISDTVDGLFKGNATSSMIGTFVDRGGSEHPRGFWREIGETTTAAS